VCEKGATPGRLGVADATAHYCWGQTADWPTTSVNNSGLTGKRLATFDNADKIAIALAQTVVLHDGEFAFVPINLKYVGAQSPGDGARIKFDFHHDAP